MTWFEVDKEGLRKLLKRRGPAFALAELIQNAWDEDSSRVLIEIGPTQDPALTLLKVEDDSPEGFKDITHAFTLFAESGKVGDPTKRGRFNLGEKLFLALCQEATIRTTSGQVMFCADGKRRFTKDGATKEGSVISALLEMDAEECADALALVQTLIPPMPTIVNGEELPTRKPLAQFHSTLPTEIANEGGELRPTERKVLVSLHEPRAGECASIYEMGIPVVATGDRFHVDIAQKVPLNMDRDNVTPSFLRRVRVVVFNNGNHLLTDEDCHTTWVSVATSHKDAKRQAVERMMDARFGKKRVAYDPTDPEANKRAVAQGYHLVAGGALTGEQWRHAKEHGLAPVSTEVVGKTGLQFGGNGEPLKEIAEEDWTDDQRRVVFLAKMLCHELPSARDCPVTIINDIIAATAYYGYDGLTFNHGRLGKAWWVVENLRAHIDLIIHELAHQIESDHLSPGYFNALTQLGSEAVILAMTARAFFKYPEKVMEEVARG